MKRNNSFDIYVDNSYEVKKLCLEYQEEYNRFLNFLLKQESNDLKVNLYATAILDKLKKAEAKPNRIKKVLMDDYHKELRLLEKEADIKQIYQAIVGRDKEKITVSSIWFVFTSFIVLLFLNNWIHETYLINYSIDILIAIVALLVAIRSENIKYRILKRYDIKKQFIVLDIGTLLICFFIKLMIVSPFDITFLLLVMEYLITQRLLKKELDTKYNA